ncbi:transposase family protein [Aquibacillus sp. 3ASR75-11]|uniref:Transposase family protein n=1 Tax=Terrihalobacillus insolitus TaxID=2950438 RepID=A0A9X3WPD7_9BACI|nr:transposase family protein [Terrihalobacillus insolitus]MDC3411933.1 transposase family protein [Terrihalobacillus insolitus]MDC3423380.1 transposase family protein [Terrihalobacillus insolitus]
MLVEIKDLDNVFHIPEPWYINKRIFDENKEQLDVYLKVDRQATFTSSQCRTEQLPFFDIGDYDQKWRHLILLEYPCYIHAEHPRTDCKNCGKTVSISLGRINHALPSPNCLTHGLRY